ncbi:isoleucine--tRNA ligase [bacterium]|nr:isoleucine--tRNA ligase [bacterium]
MFKKASNNVNFVELEENILRFWKKENIFGKTLEATRNNQKFIFYEGPPTANGAPGVHHVLSRVFKDIFPRYKTMKGYHVARKAGWDTHGLPVEIEVEKKLGINSKKEIEKIGIEKFNKLCRESVMRYEDEWKRMTERIAFWIDLDNAYFTFKNDYIETEWWILKTIWDKGLLYEGHKIVPYCPRCGTALSSHEVAQGYKDVEDLTIIVKFPLRDEKNTFLMVWTTTPWTLISNVACAVNKNAEYITVEYENEKLILNKNLAGSVFKDKQYSILNKFKGEELLNKRYEPVYDYAGGNKNAFKVIHGDFVSTEEGTGIVHIAPAFGEDDMNAGRENDLPVVQMVDDEGNFKDNVEKFGKMSITQANPLVIDDIRDRNLLFKIQKMVHSYPYCWRCDSRLIYYAKKSWYIKTSSIKENLIKSNKDVNWYPEHIKNGRYGKWLENNIDWALTRERYWGTPLPIWQDKNGHKVCIGSIEELRKLGRNVPEDLDLHKPFVDDIKIRCKICGQEMVRTPEVIDVWFDSGSMPYAQYHYPFENKELFNENFPADFICEAIDQTRGWFYTLMTISTILFNKSCYKNVLCLGLINDENGQKMSKSKGNIIKPWDILDKQGADALRWYLFTSVSPWLPKNFSIKGVDEVVRKFLLTLWNTYSFFIIYANIDNFNPVKYDLPVKERYEIDRWILSELNITVKKVNEFLEIFNVTDSGRLIQDFVDNLSNWYVRRCRRRFWKSEEDKDKISAYKTLYECLLTLSKLCAPYIPFISEEIYKNLAGSLNTGFESVHLEKFPDFIESDIDMDLSFKMGVARKAVGLGRSVRSKINIKIRQPLPGAVIYVGKDSEKINAINHFADVITEELNVKKISFANNLEDLVSYNIKPNLKLLGSKYGSLVPAIREALLNENPMQVALKVKNNKNINIICNKRKIELLPEEVLVEATDKEGLSVESDGEITVGLDTKISEELLNEGFCRELIHHIQNIRKEANFEIENIIETHISSNKKIEKIIADNIEFIKKETLSETLDFTIKDDLFIKDIKIGDSQIKIGLKVIR